MQKHKSILFTLLCLFVFFSVGVVNAYGEEVKVYSSDYRINLFGNCIYGAVIIQNEVYIPLETFRAVDNYYQVSMYQNDRRYSIQIETDGMVQPTKQEVSHTPFSWVEMGNAQAMPIDVRINYNNQESVITNDCYTLQGQYPMIKLSKLQECMPIAVDYEKRIITIGDDSKYKNLPTEADLVGQAFPEIANRSWDTVTNMKSIHDYLVKTLYYPSGEEEDPEVVAAMQHYNYRNNYTLAGKAAICEQYARLFRDFCRRSGIACMTVTGSAGGEGHEWNKVFVNNEWVYVDVTFDDPINNGKGSPNVRHSYFMKKAPQLYSSHYWQGEDYVMPEYAEDWKELDCNNVTSQEMYIKCLVGQLAKGTTHIELRVTGTGVSGGLAFLSHYANEGIINYWYISGGYSNGKYIIDVEM